MVANCCQTFRASSLLSPAVEKVRGFTYRFLRRSLVCWRVQCLDTVTWMGLMGLRANTADGLAYIHPKQDVEAFACRKEAYVWWLHPYDPAQDTRNTGFSSTSQPVTGLLVLAAGLKSSLIGQNKWDSGHNLIFRAFCMQHWKVTLTLEGHFEAFLVCCLQTCWAQ